MSWTLLRVEAVGGSGVEACPGALQAGRKTHADAAVYGAFMLAQCCHVLR